MSDFKTLYLNGTITFDKINEFIEKWHLESNNNNNNNNNLTLQEFLGLTDDEYHTSKLGLSNLKRLLDVQKNHKSIASFSTKINKHYNKSML